MEGATIGSVSPDQNTETESCTISKEISEAIQVTQVVSEAMKDSNTNKAESVEDIEMADQSDSMDELNLEIQTVESCQEPKEGDIEKSKPENNDTTENVEDFFLEIKTVETLEEVAEDGCPSAKDNDATLKKTDDGDFERDLSKVEPNRDQEICTFEKIVIQNEEDKENVLKLSYELEKLKVIVLELTNFFPHYQPRTKEKVLLNLPFRDKKELDENDFQVFKTSIESKQFGSDCSNSGIENLNEILESVSSVLTLQEKLTRSTRNVSELCNSLIEYVDHLKRKVEKAKKGIEDDKKVETIGVKKVAICRRKNNFPIVGISAKDISPIRENFCIKKVISKVEDVSEQNDEEGRSRSREKGTKRSKDRSGDISPIRDSFNVRKVLDSVEKKDKSKLIKNFKPFVRNLVLSIDRLRTNMVFALKQDDKFILKSDWEFFTNMFKKEALKWNSKEKLNHLENLDVEDHVSKKMGDPIWRFLDSKLMTEDRIERIRVYNKKLEKQFDIKHEIAEYTDEETIATRKLKRGLYHILKNDNDCLIPYEAVKLLDLLDSFAFGANKTEGGTILSRTKQDTLDFLENDDLLPETRDGCEMLEKLEMAFFSIVKKIWNLPAEQKIALGDDILNNLEFEVQRKEFLEQSSILKSKLKVLFEMDDRYCATGDEKYYLDLPGREGEKLLPSEVRKFLRDFQSDHLTKTLQSRYDKFKNEQNCDNIKSFNAKLMACVKNVGEKVKKCESEMGNIKKRRNEENITNLRDGKRNDRESKVQRRSRSRSPRSSRGSQNRRRSKSRSSVKSFRKVSRSPRRQLRSPRRRSRSRDLGRRSGLSSERNSSRNEGLAFTPFSNMNNMNNPIANSQILSAASNIIGSMTPMAVLQVMAMNGDPRAAAALTAANNSSGQDMGNNVRSQNQSQNNFPQSQRGMMTNQSSLSGVDHRPMASFGSLPDETGQPNRLLMGENQSFGGKTGLNWGNSGNVGHQRQNEMEYSRNEIESKMIRRPNQLQQNMFRNTSETGESFRPMAGMGETSKFNLRQTTDHLTRTPEINQQQQFRASNFSLGRGSEINTFGGADSIQNFPSKSNEKSPTQAWSRPKFNPFANQEERGSNQNMGDWSRGNGGRQGSGMTGNLSGQGSSFPSTSFGKTFPPNSSGPSGQFTRSFNRDAPAAQGRAFSNESPEVDGRHPMSASHTEQRSGGNFLQNSSGPFQRNNSEMKMPFKGIGSETNKSMAGSSSSLNRGFTGNTRGLERSSFQPQRNFSENSYNHSSVSGGNIPDPNRSYSQYSDNVSGPASGNINRNNLFRSMQGQNRR